VAFAETADETRQRAAALDSKFAALKAARSDSEAEPLVAAIWALWRQSGRTEIDDMLRQGIALMRMGARDPALAVFDEVIKRAPDYAEGWNTRATLLYVLGEYDRSLADCEEVLKREPRHFGALAGMGMIGIAQDNYKAALSAYRRALEVNPRLLGREIIEALERQVEGQKL
jgi:tetratricopeptide (TPR) repeat protein